MASIHEATLAELHQLLQELVEIGAPTFREEKRAHFIENWLRENTGALVGRDAIGNVWADLSGGASDIHLFDAHIDTVFPFETVILHQDGDIWRAPGVIDNTATVAILMIWLKEASGRGESLPFLASFTVGEENEGNLRGINQIAADFGPRLRDACVLDLRIDAGCRQNVGSLRFHLEWKAQGGHSWNNFGRPSAIHALAAWVAGLESAFEWQPKLHSYNVGHIEGGQGATSIAETASLKLDVRSIEPQFLADFRVWIESQIQTETFSSLSFLERPAGSVSADHPLVTRLEQVHAELQMPLAWNIYSTNANALGARGIPAITTGLTSGGSIHTEGEYLEVPSLERGLQKMRLLAARLGDFSN